MSDQRLDLDELAALESQRDFLLRSLDDLDREHEFGDLDDVDYETLKSDYTARAAVVLRSIEESHDLVAATAPSNVGFRRVIMAIAVVVVAVVAGMVVASFSGQGGPGKAAGGQDLTPSNATTSCIDFMQKAQRQANQSQMSGFVTDSYTAVKCFTTRLDAHPDDAVAAAYRGWTLAVLAKNLSGVVAPNDIEGFVRQSRADFAKASKLAPRYPDALAFAAISDVWSGDLAGATKLLTRIDALDLPANSPILAQVNQMLRPLLRTAQTAATSTTVAGSSTTVVPPAS